jgi:alpha-amylase
VFAGDVRADAFVFGELITGGGVGNLEYQLFLQPYLVGTDHAAYDFPLFHAIRGAFAFGARLDALVDPLAAGQALPGARAVTFTVTHDIPNNQGFRGLLLDPVDETLAYAFVLGRNGGAPLLYSDHNESGDNRWVDAWRRADLTAMVGFHNANRAEDMQVLAAGACHLLFRRGQRGIVGINKCGEPIELSVNIAGSGLRPLRSYRELLAGGSITLDGSVQAFVLPARSARMWLRGK